MNIKIKLSLMFCAMLFALCALPVQAQSPLDTVISNGTPFGYSTITYSLPNDSTLLRVKVSEENPLPVKAMNKYFYFAPDTLKYGDTLTYFDFNYQSLTAKLSFTTTAGDSMMIAIIDSNNTPVPCAVIDLQTGGTIPGGTHIVPGAGTKHYMIKQPSPGKVRVRRSSTFDLNHNTYVKGWGVN
jgi:hypothetical protein